MAAPLDQSTILVAEDQEHVREALAMLLRGHGYSVTLCSSPKEALAAAQQQPPDLAMVDMNYQRDSTSGLEGLQLIERLRQADGTVPIIALTAWGNVDLAVSAMKHGASDFIEKPWRNDSLLEKVSLADESRLSNSGRRSAFPITSARTRINYKRGSCRRATLLLRESSSSVRALRPEWLVETTSGCGSLPPIHCTSASPMYRAKERRAQ